MVGLSIQAQQWTHRRIAVQGRATDLRNAYFAQQTLPFVLEA
jgi:hypothetical protein